MKGITCLVLTSLLAAVCAAPSNVDDKLLEDAVTIDNVRMEHMWNLYKRRFQRSFTQKEDAIRKQIFQEKVSMIIIHNVEALLGQHTFTLSINNLTDWTPAELATLRGYRSPARGHSSERRQKREQVYYSQVYLNTVPVADLPATVNWTAQGWVGPVLNQGQCGSCWAFSSAESLAAQYYNKTRTYVQLSEQNLVDCTAYLGNLGCNGGAYQNAFEYVENGIDSLAFYPYTGVDGTCVYVAANSITVDNGWWNIEENNELALQQAVALVGPVSVAIDAGLPSFQLYKSGVYAPAEGCTSLGIDHAVLAVGYGTTSAGQDYWLLKNSWGTSWGIDGYMMMARNDNNMCGIAHEPAVPIIN